MTRPHGGLHTQLCWPASPGQPSRLQRAGPHLWSVTRKTPRSKLTRGPRPRHTLQRPPCHSLGRSHLQRGLRVKQKLLRAAQGARPQSPSPGREDPLPAHRASPAQVGSGRSVSTSAEARGDAGRPGQATPELGSAASRWSPTSET